MRLGTRGTSPALCVDPRRLERPATCRLRGDRRPPRRRARGSHLDSSHSSRCGPVSLRGQVLKKATMKDVTPSAQRSTSLRAMSPRSAMVEAAARFEGRHNRAVVGLVEPQHESLSAQVEEQQVVRVAAHQSVDAQDAEPRARDARIRDDAFWLSQGAEAKGVAAQLEHGRRLLRTPPRSRHDAHAAEHGGRQVGARGCCCAWRDLGRGRDGSRSPGRPRRHWLCGRRGNRRAGLAGSGGGSPGRRCHARRWRRGPGEPPRSPAAWA